jgi:RNA polymerase sigma factor (sigma-70 family)
MNLEEEEKLVHLCEWGDMRAKETLFHANYAIIGTIIKNYTVSTGIEYNDLYSEGSIGLWIAIDKYKLGRGTKLISYANYWIRDRINKALSMKSRVIRVPVHLVQKGCKFQKKKAAIELEVNRELTQAELKEIDAKGQLAASACLECISISQNIYNEGDSEHGPNSSTNSIAFEDTYETDEIPVTERMFMAEMILKIPALLKKIRPRYRKVIKQRYGIGCRQHTLDEIADDENVTRERIRQLQKAALKELREQMIKMI